MTTEELFQIDPEEGEVAGLALGEQTLTSSTASRSSSSEDDSPRNEEEVSTPVPIKFTDPLDHTLIDQDAAEIDLDNVVLTDESQQMRLTIQCLKSKPFWLLYTMQMLSISKLHHFRIFLFELICLICGLCKVFGYYVVNADKSFGLTVSGLNDDKYLT